MDQHVGLKHFEVRVFDVLEPHRQNGETPSENPPEGLFKLRVVIVQDYSQEVIDVIEDRIGLTSLTVSCNVRSEPHQLLKEGYLLFIKWTRELNLVVNEVSPVESLDEAVHIPLSKHVVTHLRVA